jgi:hypothetical protein
MYSLITEEDVQTMTVYWGGTGAALTVSCMSHKQKYVRDFGFFLLRKLILY